MAFGTLALILAAAGPTGPGHAPQRYRLDVTLNQEVDLTALGMDKQVSELTATYWLSVTTSDTTGGKVVHAVIDSLTFAASGQMGQQPGYAAAMADSARGQSLHAYIVDGKVKSAPTPSSPMPLVAMATQSIALIFPGVRGNLTTGGTWADTTATTATNENGSTNGQLITLWTVTGMEGAAFVLSGIATGTNSGEQGENSFTGTVTTTIQTTSVAGGPATKAVVQSTQALSYLIPQAPDPIPIKQTTAATMVAIP